MQLQMEVCDLDDCEFLETRFKEYESKEEFYEDTTESGDYMKSKDEKLKGIIMYFLNKNGVPVYEYKPITMNIIEYESKWVPKIMYKNESMGNKFIGNIYWWLDEISCVIVERNKLWFSLVVNKMQNFWNIILKERISGFSHRAPNKRKVKTEQIISKQCLISIDGELINPNNTKEQDNIEVIACTPCLVPLVPDKPSPTIMHIRTQSIDETTL